MPFEAYGTLDDEDIYCVIAYLRSIPPIKNDIPSSKSDFPVSFLINTMAKEGHPSKRPPQQDSLKYGKYITTVAGCLDCHAKMDAKDLASIYYYLKSLPPIENNIVKSKSLSR